MSNIMQEFTQWQTYKKTLLKTKNFLKQMQCVNLKDLYKEKVLCIYWCVFPFHVVQSANTEFMLKKIHRILKD